MCSPVSFSVAVQLLMASYKRLQKKLHPDKFAQASKVRRGRFHIATARSRCQRLLDGCNSLSPLSSSPVAAGCVRVRVCAACLSLSALRSTSRTARSKTRTPERCTWYNPKALTSRCSKP